MPDTQVKAQYMTRDEYFRLSDEGYFQDRRVELIGGEIVDMAAQKNPHAVGVSLVQDALQQAFGANYWARGQATLNLSPVFVPDPDVAVVSGARRTWTARHMPTSALVVVEVSETTLAFDQTRKASFYAAAGIQDYWVLNLIDGQLEVYRNPRADSGQASGFGYANTVIIGPIDHVTPLALPSARIPVADLLP